MGRFTTQQAYADNNPNTRRISYERAVGAETNSSTQPVANKLITEKVLNPHGSTAGAGSSEFHIYRQARTREALRWQELDQEERKKVLDSKFNAKVESWKKEEEETTAKNRKKRQRQKEAKKRKKNMKLSGAFLHQSETLNSDEGDQQSHDSDEFENGLNNYDENGKAQSRPLTSLS